jgi:hypothetical protein
MDFPSTFNFLTQTSELGCGFIHLGHVSHLFNFIGFVLIFEIFVKILKFSDLPRFWKPPKEIHLDTQLKSAVEYDDGVVGLDEKEKEEDLEKMIIMEFWSPNSELFFFFKFGDLGFPFYFRVWKPKFRDYHPS